MSEGPDELAAAMDSVADLPGAQFMQSHLLAQLSTTADGIRAWDEYRLGGASELDLHLHGSRADGHTERAVALGRFMQRSADAVKELAKGISGKQRHTAGLEVFAPTSGSVRVVFRVPVHTPKGAQKETVPETESESLDSMALHQLAALFLQASDRDDDLLSGAVEALNGSARNALRLLAEVVVQSAWEVDGFLSVKGHPRQEVRLTTTGASYLMDVASRESTTVDDLVETGDIDGWIWSKSVMRFVPEGKPAFQAVVPPALQAKVARIVGQSDHQASAKFLVTTTFRGSDATSASRSYLLQDVEPIDQSVLEE